MTLFIALWAVGSVVAFLALRLLALRDFGAVTVGGAILLAIFSLAAPAALLAALVLSLESGVGIFGKVVWRKDAA